MGKSVQLSAEQPVKSGGSAGMLRVVGVGVAPSPDSVAYAAHLEARRAIAILVTDQRRAIRQLALLAHQKTPPRHVCRFGGTPSLLRLMPAASSARIASGPRDRFSNRSSVSDR